MQRWGAKLRSLGAHSNQLFSAAAPRRLLHTSPLIQQNFPSTLCRSSIFSNAPLFNAYWPVHSPSIASRLFQSTASSIQVRHVVSSRDRRSKRKRLTPVVSKVKKIKMKFYSSFKDRFRPLNDGTIRRWKEGKRHNAHLKSKKSKRRLRKPGIVPPAYAKVMKKLGFLA